jgi:hypothetical protein
MSGPFRPFPAKSGLCSAAHIFTRLELCGRTFGQLATLEWEIRGRGIEGGRGGGGGGGTGKGLAYQQAPAKANRPCF